MTRIEYKVIVEEIARIFDTIPNDGSRRLAEQWIADKFAAKDAEVNRLREACLAARGYIDLDTGDDTNDAEDAFERMAEAVKTALAATSRGEGGINATG